MVQASDNEGKLKESSSTVQTPQAEPNAGRPLFVLVFVGRDASFCGQLKRVGRPTNPRSAGGSWRGGGQLSCHFNGGGLLGRGRRGGENQEAEEASGSGSGAVLGDFGKIQAGDEAKKVEEDGLATEAMEAPKAEEERLAKEQAKGGKRGLPGSSAKAVVAIITVLAIKKYQKRKNSLHFSTKLPTDSGSAS